MRVLVTGAAGFIGSNLCEYLLARGDEVVGIDNLDAYYPLEYKRRNLQALLEPTGQPHQPASSRLAFIQLDIREREKVHELFSRQRFDAVAHLAGMAGVRHSETRARLYTDANVLGTLNLLDAATETALKGPFVFASTSSVYGTAERIPFVESDPCDRVLAPYPASKRSVELFGHSYHHLSGLNFTALRFFTVYGPRNRPDMMAHMLLDNIAIGRPLKLYNDGLMWRDWTYVGDITRGIGSALERPLGYEVLNLGRGTPVLLRDFVAQIESLAGAKAQLQRSPMPSSDMPRTYADITRARDLLGYEPRVALEEGTAELYRWYCAERACPQSALQQPNEHRG